jgi:PKD repeat protein
MKAYAVLVVMMLFVSGMVLALGGSGDQGDEVLSSVETSGAEDNDPETTESRFTPQPEQEFQNDPMSFVLNSRRADRGPYYLDFHQVERGVSAVASILHGEDFARVFRYPYIYGQTVSSKYNDTLDATLDLYVNSMDVPGKTVRFKVEIDRNGDGINDTTIDFPSFTTEKNASPERVIRKGTVFMDDADEISPDMSNARVYLKVWRTDTVDDLNNRLKVYAGFLSDTEMKVESRLMLPWINPVPHVEINSPLDRNLTGKFYFNNEPIFFDGRGSRDPTGEALGSDWRLDRGLIGWPVYDTETFNRTFKEPGWYTITLNVTNSLYFSNQTSVTIQVVYKNHPPKLIPTVMAPSGFFEPVPDQITTYTHVPQEWFASATDVDEDEITYSWDFDDGFKSTAARLNHSYKVPGDYLLKVEVFDGNETNGRVNKTILVRVEPNHAPVGVIELSGAPWTDITPPMADPRYRGFEVRINLGDTIRFDASKSYDPDGLFIKSYRWDFDDVYATEDNPTIATLVQSSHKFLVEGEYNVTLTLFDGVKYGYTNVWIRTNNAPIAVPPATMRAETEEILSFDGSRSSDPDSEDHKQYKWDFGDNTRTDWSDSAFATHAYRITAIYTATLYVTDELLQHTATVRVIIDPKNHDPVAEASILEDEDDLWTNMTIHFSSIGSYDIDGEGRISFTWDFDDGSDPSTLANPAHVYEDPGTYTVVLTVIDQNNVINTAELVLTVKRNYGDTDIVIRALERNSQKPFRDPKPDELSQVAVMRDGWVAYMCDLKKGYEMEVKITIIGDRPADVYLLKDVHFQTYKRNPQVTFVPFEAKGYKQGVTGDFKYTYQARESGRFYVVIDNKDWPMGTETEGPVDYTVEFTPKWEIEGTPGPSAVMALAAVGVVALVGVASRRRLR